MKKIKIALYMLAIGSLFASCDDTLDIVQSGQVNPSETYVDYPSIEKNFYGIYITVSNSNQIGFNSIWTDENAIGVANGGQGISDGMWSYVLNPSNGYAAGIWSSNYSTISNINRFIKSVTKYIDTNNVDAEELAKINQLLVEVRGLRAYAYHELMTYFVTDYTNDSGLGVMLFDDVREFGSPNLPRATVGEVYQFIEDDLDFLEANYDISLATAIQNSQAKQFFVSKGFSYALRARMNLYRKNYTEAITYANLALAETPMAASSTYAAIWNDTGVADVIFKLSRTPLNSKIGTTWASISVDPRSGSQFYEVGRSLYNLSMETGATADVRKNVITHSSSIVAQNYTQTINYRADDVLSVGKYATSENTRLLGDLKVFRASEMALIKAEAYLFLNQTTDSQTALNDLRTKRLTGAGSTRTFGTDFQTNLRYILTERRLELAFEGFRWVDIKRLGAAANVTFDRDQMDCSFNNTCNSAPDATSYKFTLPIPASEISSNTLMQQNPGY